jgi:hypothetical protein
MRNTPSSAFAPAGTDRWQQSGSYVERRLYGMKRVSECSCHPSGGGVPVEMLDSSSMETKPLRRR